MKSNINEHTLQKNVVSYLRTKGYITINTDMMIGLKFLKSQPQRIGFISNCKALGYSVGQFDLVVITQHRGVWFLELKNGKKGTLSKEQKELAKLVQDWGYNYAVIREFEDIVAIL